MKEDAGSVIVNLSASRSLGQPALTLPAGKRYHSASINMEAPQAQNEPHNTRLYVFVRSCRSVARRRCAGIESGGRKVSCSVATGQNSGDVRLHLGPKGPELI